jgi:hypothetical protein
MIRNRMNGRGVIAALAVVIALGGGTAFAATAETSPTAVTEPAPISTTYTPLTIEQKACLKTKGFDFAQWMRDDAMSMMGDHAEWMGNAGGTDHDDWMGKWSNADHTDWMTKFEVAAKECSVTLPWTTAP